MKQQIHIDEEMMYHVYTVEYKSSKQSREQINHFCFYRKRKHRQKSIRLIAYISVCVCFDAFSMVACHHHPKMDFSSHDVLLFSVYCHFIVHFSSLFNYLMQFFLLLLLFFFFSQLPLFLLSYLFSLSLFSFFPFFGS